jgi:hypothetical protein
MMDDIPRNAEGFSNALLEMAKYVDGEAEKVIRKACIDLYRRIVERTPVDTGRAKASWMIDVVDTSQTAGEGEYSASEIKGIIQSHISDFKFEIGDGVVIIYNNLEYISYLENGTSQQAPSGMVAVSLAEFESHFNTQLGGLI